MDKVKDRVKTIHTKKASPDRDVHVKLKNE